MVSREWESPDVPLLNTHRLGQLYVWSPGDLEQWLAYPKVDALVTGVTKHTTIPVEGGAALKDPQD